MKKIKTLFALAAGLFLFAACSSVPTDQEQVLSVSQDYIKAFQNFDDASMSQYCVAGLVDETQNKEMSAQEAALFEEIKKQVASRVYACDSARIEDSGVDAVVYVSCTDGEKSQQSRIRLTKTEQGWKVSKGLSVK